MSDRFRKARQPLLRQFCMLVMLIGTGAGLGGCGRMSASNLIVGDEPFAGTYEIEICRGECAATGSSDVLSRGYLVLADSVYAWAQIPEAAQAYYEAHDFVLTVIRAGRAPNACFVLDRGQTDETYAGITPVGVTVWRPIEDSGNLEVSLFHSPDAGYVATIAVAGGRLHGRGRSWGAGDWHVDLPDNGIQGRRIGPPEWDRCFVAAEARAATGTP
jgi:hypothetical protein